MTFYQHTKNNPFKLPHNTYMSMRYLLRDYERLRKELLSYTGSYDERMRAGVARRQPESDPEYVHELTRVLCAIGGAMQLIPEEYRRGLWRYIRYGESYSSYAHRNTWRKWHNRLCFHTAEKLDLVRTPPEPPV